jgi:hypothetical protein
MEFTSNPEFSLIVQDQKYVRARDSYGAEASGRIEQDNLYRKLIAVFQDWLSQEHVFRDLLRKEQVIQKPKIIKREQLELFGAFLYRMLFGGDVGAFFERKLANLQEGERLRVQLSFQEQAADLASVPWEYLYYPDTETRRGFFFATSVNLVLSRYMPLTTARQNLAPAQGPLCMLIVSCKPKNLGPVLSESVIEAVQKLGERYPFKIDILHKPTLESFLETLQATKPHVVHYIGHGNFDKTSGRGAIALLTEDELSRWVEDREFTDYFLQMRQVPRLVFLHLCEGAANDFTANFGGLAPQLIRANIQAVVGMQYPISNRAAISFSRAFYRELIKGEPVDSAVQIGRWRITTEDPNAYDSRDFGTPVLYMRSWDGVIQPAAESPPANGQIAKG